jgi:HSP20 family protein
MSDEPEQAGNVALGEREPRGRLAWPEDVERYFDRAMRDFFSTWPWLHLGRGPRWIWRREERLPDIEAFERRAQIVVRVDLPVRKPEDIDVSAESGMLVVHSRRKVEAEISDEDRCERAAGEFTRSIRLPEGINAEAIGASYQDGVLEVTIPRPGAPEAKMVTVQVK